MHRGRSIVAVCVLACSAHLACGDDAATTADIAATEPGATSATSCEAHVSTIDPSAPVATFEADVAPVLAASCGFSSCHGSRSAGNHGVYLGADAAEVKAGLLKPSRTLPAMPLVTPSAPAESFLLHKLDDDFCTLPACADGACGRSMPSGNPLLPEATRDAIRRWIAQGAR